MTRIIIHAGLPKTGSTFLQDFIFPGLDEKECEYNPEVLTKILIEISKESQSGAVIEASKIEKFQNVINDSLKSIKAPTLLISVEGLMPIHCGEFKSADQILKVVKIFFPLAEIVVFLREQVTWIRSAYSFCLVSKYILPFDEFVNRSSPGNFESRSHDGLNLSVYDYDYQKIRELTNQHFQSAHFFRFEDLFLSQENDILQRFSVILGVSPLKLLTKQSSNKGLNEDLMVLISKTIKLIPFRSPWKPAYLYTRYSKIKNIEKLKYYYLRNIGRIVKFLAEAVYKILPQNKTTLFSASEEIMIRDYYLESNEKFWSSLKTSHP